MAETEESWRKAEPSLDEVIERHPDISPFVILKTDVQRRGITFSEDALNLVDPRIHQCQYAECTREQTGGVPSSLMMRDGTSILTGFKSKYAVRTPYLVDAEEGKIVLKDQGRVIDEVFYWEKPDFYDHVTSTGKPMWQVVSARPQRLDIYPHHYCEFWDTPGYGCKYCAAAAISCRQDERQHLNTVGEIGETVREALKEKGRYENIFLTAGTVLSGRELLDDEVETYIRVLQEVGRNFPKTEANPAGRFPSQLIGTAYSKKQLKRLYDETGLMSYTADIEVLDKEKFEWICPGKAKRIGYDEWVRRLYDAVDIFGEGYVNTGLVGGVELAEPDGFDSEREALESDFRVAEEMARHGVAVQASVWTVSDGSIFFRQKVPSLEYYVELAEGLDQIRRDYHLPIDMDNYRRCGNHPDTDLSRI